MPAVRNVKLTFVCLFVWLDYSLSSMWSHGSKHPWLCHWKLRTSRRGAELLVHSSAVVIVNYSSVSNSTVCIYSDRIVFSPTLVAIVPSGLRAVASTLTQSLLDKRGLVLVQCHLVFSVLSSYLRVVSSFSLMSAEVSTSVIYTLWERQEQLAALRRVVTCYYLQQLMKRQLVQRHRT